VVDWPGAFALTLAIELPVYVWRLRRLDFSPGAAAASALGANAVSHPLFWFAFPRFSPYALFFTVGEALCIAIEWVLLQAARRSTGARAAPFPLLVAALAANAASAAAGLLILAARP
jgi:hypothetical protein